MDEARREQVKVFLDKLDDQDTDHAEGVLKDSYKGEIDRKDKILSSMSVLTAPITILAAGVAFLVNSVLDAGQGLLTSDPDITQVLLYVALLSLFFLIIIVTGDFNRLLAGENYHYLPDADDLLDSMARNKEYCLDNNILDEGAASRYSRLDIIMQMAESATKNCAANDVRLRYRQKIFRNTMFAVIAAGGGFISVALHRELPNLHPLSDIWRHLNGKTPTSAQHPPSTPNRTQAASGHEQSVTSPAASGASSGH